MTSPAPEASTSRARLLALLGDLPERHGVPEGEPVQVREHDTYREEHWVLALNEQEPVPAVLLRPQRTEPGPAVLYHHAHGNDYVRGKDELLAGRPALRRPYGPELVEQGFTVLCIDAWCFGERRGRSESATFKEMLWKGEVLWGQMVFDTLRAFDFLAGHPQVQADRIVSMGLSMGGTMALWAAALEPRIQACVDLCSLTDFQALIDQQGLDGHGLYYYVPGLLKHFSALELNHLVCPRPRLSVVGRHDPLTPIAGVQLIDSVLTESYRQSGAQGHWTLRVNETGHFETEASHQQVRDFLSALNSPSLTS